MESNGILCQEAESFVFDEENCEGKNSKIKRRNRWCYYLYYIIIPSVVTIITFVLMVVIDRKLIPLWSHPLINSSSAETASFQLSKTEALKAEEDTKRETRASAHLFYNPNSPNKTSVGANSCVMWDISTSGSFVSEGIIFQSDTNSLQVKKSGIYQVYSKLTLKNYEKKSTGEQKRPPSSSALMKNGNQLTMEQFRSPLPGEDNIHHVLHFGIYLLDADDKLCVTLSNDSDSSILKRARTSFFGLNLIGPI
ncbi:hypothetical protein CHS0354_029745 [Potamilus streckersoni]|uniref:THD domain-containing protein n=1 Tax=Potamilus streckersoni TaxID=2493646 RepID=A0AAE0TIL4_9BIVA|nr:hypothetical protein CHS0354_029745 [Potamilus streckersoni]